MALTYEEKKIYMTLSLDANERGRLWQERKYKELKNEMIEYYDSQLLKKLKEKYDLLHNLGR